MILKMLEAIISKTDAVNGLTKGATVFVPEGAVSAMDLDGYLPVIALDGRGCWTLWTNLNINTNLLEQSR